MDGSAPAASPLTALAVQNEGLLRAIAAGSHDSRTALAEAAGVLVSNLNRKLEALQGEGLIEYADVAATHQPTLSAAGRAVLDALDRAHGQPAPAPNAVRLRYDQLRRDPDNARTHSGLSGEEFEGLVASIREKGILSRIEVRAPDALGICTILKGERRWRAWGRMLSEGRWSADHTEEVVVVEGDEEHLTEVAIIDNVQRADLDNLEKAEAYFKLHGRFGRSPQEIAARIGTTDRHVQELLRVAEKATPLAKAAYWDAKAQGVKDAWTTLRDSVKTPKHIVELEKNARLRLFVIEMACRSLLEHGVWDATLVVSRTPPGGVASIAVELELSRTEWDIGQVRSRLTPLACDWLHEQLDGGSAHPGESRGDPNALLAQARIEALGPMGAVAVPEGKWGIEFLNPPPPPPPPNPSSAEPAAPTEPAREGEDAGPAAPVPASRTSSLDAGAGRAAQSGLVGDDFSQQLRSAVADEREAPPPETAAGPAEPTPPPPLIPEPKLDITPAWRLILIEVAHKIEHHGQETRGGAIRGAPVDRFHSDAEAMKLQHGGLIGFVQNAASTGYLAILPPRALDYLAAEGFGAGIGDAQLVEAINATLSDSAREAWLANTDPIDCDHRYATGWLNVAPAKKPPRPEPAPKVPDPVMLGFRTAFADLHKAADEALVILTRILNGDGAGDDEIGQAVDRLKAAVDNGKPYLPREPG